MRNPPAKSKQESESTTFEWCQTLLMVTSILLFTCCQSWKPKVQKTKDLRTETITAPECRSWWESNVCWKRCSALKARIVQRPCSDDDRWENTGLRAAQGTHTRTHIRTCTYIKHTLWLIRKWTNTHPYSLTKKGTWTSTMSIRVYSHREGPIIHLLWSGPNRCE